MSFRFFKLFAVLLVFGQLCVPGHAVPWFPFGPDGGDARSFAADPQNHQHMYLGTTNGWVYQSLDGGRKWARLASVGKRDDLILDDILVDPVNPKHIVVGAHVAADLHHPDGGIYLSEDGGMTWTAQKDMRGQSIMALTAAPSDPKVLVAGSMDGVYRSSDSGVHWARISSPSNAELHEVESLAIDPVNPKIIYAGTWHLPWKTTDGGATWTGIKQGIIEDSDVFSIIIDPKQPSVVYASACSGIYKSEDAGEKFVGGVGVNRNQGIPSSARRTRVLMQDANHLDTVYAGTTTGLYRTDDAGKHWTQTTSSDVIVNDVYVDPKDSKRVLLATDRQGVLASNDGGTSFVASNDGFSSRQIVAYAADAQHPATVYVGVVNDKEAGGVFVSKTGGLSWSQVSAGLEGRDVYSLAQAPDGTMLAGTVHGIYRLNGVVWERAGEGDAKTAVGTKPVPGKPVAGKPGAARAKPASAAVVKSPVVAKGKAGVKSRVMDAAVYSLATVGESVYAASSLGLLRSGNNGASWALVAALPTEDYRFIASSKSGVVVASLRSVELSSDGGSTWTAVQMPPKVTQVGALALDGHGGVWVGGRDGVFYSANRGASWQTPNGLYITNVSNLFYDAKTDRVLATSYGPATEVFAVELPTMTLTKWDAGWNLRFARPVGDHLVAGTLFDGIVVQPRMVESATPVAATASR